MKLQYMLGGTQRADHCYHSFGISPLPQQLIPFAQQPVEEAKSPGLILWNSLHRQHVPHLQSIGLPHLKPSFRPNKGQVACCGAPRILGHHRCHYGHLTACTYQEPLVEARVANQHHIPERRLVGSQVTLDKIGKCVEREPVHTTDTAAVSLEVG